MKCYLITSICHTCPSCQIHLSALFSFRYCNEKRSENCCWNLCQLRTEWEWRMEQHIGKLIDKDSWPLSEWRWHMVCNISKMHFRCKKKASNIFNTDACTNVLHPVWCETPSHSTLVDIPSHIVHISIFHKLNERMRWEMFKRCLFVGTKFDLADLRLINCKVSHLMITLYISMKIYLFNSSDPFVARQRGFLITYLFDGNAAMNFKWMFREENGKIKVNLISILSILSMCMQENILILFRPGHGFHATFTAN